jgi:hypothetical protein
MDSAAQGEETQRCAKGMEQQSRGKPEAQQPPLHHTSVGASPELREHDKGAEEAGAHLPMRPLKSTSKRFAGWHDDRSHHMDVCQ